VGLGAAAIHGNKSQGQRERALADFRAGKVRTLIATDIAARGIDVDGISHVVNYDLPNIPESYVHRIGRTARAGATGVAISFCDGEERAFLRDIEKLIRITIPATDRRGDRPASLPVSESAAREPREHHRPARQSRPRNGQHQDRPRNGHGQPQPERKANNNHHHNGRNAGRQQERRDQPRAASDGSIASVSFLKSKSPRAQGQSSGGAHRAPR
jgi:ATP-dependent RNA helicase RhlE